MTSTRDRRITKELADLIQDQDNSGISVCAPDESDLTKLIGTFPGPPDTVYAGGKFEVQIRIPNNYPFKPPRMSLTTKIWHPNISSQTVSVPRWCPAGPPKLTQPTLVVLAGRYLP